MNRMKKEKTDRKKEKNTILRIYAGINVLTFAPLIARMRGKV